jgi:hypothetical protein
MDHEHRSPSLHTHLTKHAATRMSQRNLSNEAICMAMAYGRIAKMKGGCEVYALGRKEVRKYWIEDGIDLSKFEGIQVVCGANSTAIITAYRDSNFRDLRPREYNHRRAA